MVTVTKIPKHSFYVIRFYERNACVVIPRTWIITLHGGVAYVTFPSEITRALVEYNGLPSMNWEKTYVQVEQGFDSSTEAYDYLDRISNESAVAEQVSERQPASEEKTPNNRSELEILLINSSSVTKDLVQTASYRNPNIIILGKSPEQRKIAPNSPDNEKKKKAIPGLMPLNTLIRQSESQQSVSSPRPVEESDYASPGPSSSTSFSNTTQGISQLKIKDVEESGPPKEIETEVTQETTQGTSKTIQKEHILTDKTNVVIGCNEIKENFEIVDKSIEDVKKDLLKMHISLSQNIGAIPYMTLDSSTPSSSNVKEQGKKTNNPGPIIDKTNKLLQSLSKLTVTSENSTMIINSNVKRLISSSQNEEKCSKHKIILLKALRNTLQDINATFEDLKTSRDNSSTSVKDILQTIKGTRMLIDNSYPISSKKVIKRIIKPGDIAETIEHRSIDSDWTLRYPVPLAGKTTELVPGFHIYVDKEGLKACEQQADHWRDMVELLLHQIFTNRALKECSMSGKKPNIGSKKPRPGLNRSGIRALMNYIKRDWNVTGKIVTKCISNYITKCHNQKRPISSKYK